MGAHLVGDGSEEAITVARHCEPCLAFRPQRVFQALQLRRHRGNGRGRGTVGTWAVARALEHAMLQKASGENHGRSYRG